MRTYIPAIGARVKLREFNSYTSRNIHVWAWFDVLSVDQTAQTATIQHNNAGVLLETVTVPLAEIQSPLGWQPRYTIAVKPDKVQTVLEWFARGIAVHVSHDIGNYSESFQPLDSATSPGWRYPEETDRILAEDCAKIFRIISVEQEEINSYINPSHPKLSTMNRKERNKAFADMRADGWIVEYVRYAGGYWTRRRETIVHDWTETDKVTA